MFRNTFLLVALVHLFMFPNVHSEESSSNDLRKIVSMPEQARELMRKEMLDHLATLNEIIGHVADNNLDRAADVAESRMGKSSMGKHRSNDMAPGRIMSPEMRNIGRGMHNAASEFSQVAKQGDLKSAYSALQKITSACVACHYSYRTK